MKRKRSKEDDQLEGEKKCKLEISKTLPIKVEEILQQIVEIATKHKLEKLLGIQKSLFRNLKELRQYARQQLSLEHFEGSLEKAQQWLQKRIASRLNKSQKAQFQNDQKWLSIVDTFQNCSNSASDNLAFCVHWNMPICLVAVNTLAGFPFPVFAHVVNQQTWSRPCESLIKECPFLLPKHKGHVYIPAVLIAKQVVCPAPFDLFVHNQTQTVRCNAKFQGYDGKTTTPLGLIFNVTTEHDKQTEFYFCSALLDKRVKILQCLLETLSNHLAFPSLIRLVSTYINLGEETRIDHMLHSKWA